MQLGPKQSAALHCLNPNLSDCYPDAQKILKETQGIIEESIEAEYHARSVGLASTLSR